MSFMFNPYPYDDPNAFNVLDPSGLPLSELVEGSGASAAAEAAKAAGALKRAEGWVIAVDGYSTAPLDTFRNLLEQQLALLGIPVTVMAVEELWQEEETLSERLAAENLQVDLEKEPVLVLVTMQHACARLIRAGVDLALREGRPVTVLHVVNPDAAPGGEPAINGQALDYLYALSGEAGAEMCVLTSNVPVTAIANYAADCGARHVIMGGGGQACGIAETLSQLLPGVRVMILERE